MQLTLLSGYPDFVGRRQIFCGFGHGPDKYDKDGDKDLLFVPPFGFVIDVIFPALTTSGKHVVYGFSKGVGARQKWALKWVKVSDGKEEDHHHDLSEEMVQLGGFGGQF